jgi:lipopolysaccharide/colanic/teichoic acid biosynthesis glycosyltransferase
MKKIKLPSILIELLILFFISNLAWIFSSNLKFFRDAFPLGFLSWSILVIFGYLLGEFSNSLKSHFGFNLKTQFIFLAWAGIVLFLSFTLPKLENFIICPQTLFIFWLYLGFLAPLLKLLLQKLSPLEIILVTNEHKTKSDFKHLSFQIKKTLSLNEFIKSLETLSNQELSQKNFLLLSRTSNIEFEHAVLLARKKGVYHLVALDSLSFTDYLCNTHYNIHIETCFYRPTNLIDYRIKRLIDYTLAGFLLISTTPLFLLIAICIKLESKGPVFYYNRCLGKYQTPFNLYEFRTTFLSVKENHSIISTTNLPAQEVEPTLKLYNNLQITRVGKILRKLNLDKLPQLINIIKGEMSLIGPRPATKIDIPYYKKISLEPFFVLPGILRPSQNLKEPWDSYEKLIELDIEYVKQWSLFKDFKILFKTLAGMISGSINNRQ